MSNISTVDLPN